MVNSHPKSTCFQIIFVLRISRDYDIEVQNLKESEVGVDKGVSKGYKETRGVQGG